MSGLFVRTAVKMYNTLGIINVIKSGQREVNIHFFFFFKERKEKEKNKTAKFSCSNTFFFSSS